MGKKPQIMLLPLKCHPQSTSPAVTAIDVELIRENNALALHFCLSGDIEHLTIPPREISERRDNLWRHTCFEAFIGVPTRPEYLELNFSPATHWAAYRFCDYRHGQTNAVNIDPPMIETQTEPGRFEMVVSLKNVSPAPDLKDDLQWRIGLSAVIEETQGGLSYWALNHPPGKPDFHHSDCFALQLGSA